MARNVIRMTDAVIAAHSAAVVAATGVAPVAAQYDAVRGPLERLMRSSAWPKLRVLWLPMGADGDLNAMRIALVEASGTKGLVNTGFLAGDYTAAGGLVGASGKKLVTTYAANAAATASYPALSASEWGFGCFMIAHSAAGSGVLAGMDTVSSDYLAFSGTNVSQMFNSVQAAHINVGLLHSVQASGGSVQTWHGGWQRAATVGSGSLPASAFSINARNSGLYSTGTHGGFWAGEAMTQAEMLALSDFFIDSNQALGRPVFLPSRITGFGDSITLGSINITTAGNKWLDRVAGTYGLTASNQGLNGASMSSYAGASSVFSSDTITAGYSINVMRNRGGVNLIAFGVNDSNNGVADEVFRADCSKVVGNLVLMGIRPETLALLSPYYQPGGTTPVDDARSQRFATIIKNISAQYGIAYVDVLNGRARGQPASNWDSLGVHGNDAMHGLFALDIKAALGAAWQTDGVAVLA